MDYILGLAQFFEKLLENKNLTSKKLSKFIKPAKKGLKIDFAMNCFALKRDLNKDGPEIAQDIINLITEDVLLHFPFIAAIEGDGPYINIILNKASMAADIFPQILSDVRTYAKSHYLKTQKSARLVVEYPSPNTNKPLHLGHVRNMLLGQSLSLINQKVDNTVFQTNLFNDRGIHICKSMWAYQKFGEKKTPESENRKSDHFVGDFYVKFAQEEARLKNGLEDQIAQLENERKKPLPDQNVAYINQLTREIDATDYGKMQKELKQMLVDWENKDPEVRALWRMMNDWAEMGYKKTFEIFKIKHDKTYFESEIYNKGKEIVVQGLKKGVFEELEDGAIIAKFKKKGLPKQKVFVRRDGTTLYATQDLYLAYSKMADFNYDRSIYVIGNEQNMQLRTIFAVLNRLGMKAENFHYSYGMINLTTGKMKSREGTVVDADDILEELELLALDAIRERYDDLDETVVVERAHVIAMAALRFFILKYDYARDFLFDPKQSIAFEGETGPYILYSYARICSVFRKAIKENIHVPFDPITSEKEMLLTFDSNLVKEYTDSHEQSLIEYLQRYPEVMTDSARHLKPHLLTRYLYELAQEFTRFYHACPILQENVEIQTARLWLIEVVRIVLKDGLQTLNIEVLNEM
ncbi:Arginine--tRNA ligase [Candidatus Lokiarchaeum ossiferum]|uniref:Arginine--tRNA ligase n=1 Tax=Candidatus Lokiarchaeum ossiferum TaxID=2951803 RepID=A0ABY6HY03_9ARCH|nr:Arginine--tRNA ligase [Candidatus Lokiarchaeum sp. B-35]